MRLKPLSRLSYLIGSLLIGGQVLAGEIFLPGSQVHGRMGMVTGSLSGPITSTFSTIPTFELEYEKFLTTKESIIMRAIFAMDSASAKTQYAYAGAGQRFYIRGTTSHPITSADKEASVEIEPMWRYYWGWDIGASSVLVQEVTETFDAVSTMADFGASAGASRRVTKNFYWDASGRFSYGYGFSSVAVNAMIINLSFGATYFF